MKGFQVKTLASAVTLALMASAPAVSQANVYKNHAGDETLECSVSVKRNVSLTHLAQSSSVPLTSKKKYKSFTLRSCQQGTVNFVSLLFV